MKLINFKSQRFIFFCGFVICLVLMSIALYFEHVMSLEPCPLCIFQRIAVMITGGVCFLAFVHNPLLLWRRIYAALISLLSLVGIGLSARHLWLQSLPPEKVPSCGPGLEYMLDVFPLTEVLSFVLKGSGECAKVSWTFLGVSIPGWTLLVFVVFLVVSVYLMLTRKWLPQT